MKELMKKMWLSGTVRDKFFDILESAFIEPSSDSKKLYLGTYIPTDNRDYDMSDSSDTHCVVSSGGIMGTSELEKFYKSKFLRSDLESMKVSLINVSRNYGGRPSFVYSIDSYDNINDYVASIISGTSTRHHKITKNHIVHLYNYAVVTGDVELLLNLTVKTCGNVDNYSKKDIPLYLMVNNKSIEFDLDTMDEFFSNSRNMMKLVTNGFDFNYNSNHISFFILITLRYDNSILKDYFNNHFTRTKTMESAHILKHVVNTTIKIYDSLVSKNEIVEYVSTNIIDSIINKKFRTKEGTVPKKDIDYVAYLICNYEHLKKDEIDRLIEKYQLSYDSIFLRVLAGSSNTKIDLLKRLEIIKGDTSKTMRTIINSLFNYSIGDEWDIDEKILNCMTGDHRYNYLMYNFVKLSDKDIEDIKPFIIYYTNYFIEKQSGKFSNVLDNLSLIIDGNQRVNDLIVEVLLEVLYFNYDRNINKISKFLMRDGIELTNVLANVKYKEFKKHYIKSLI